MKLEDLKLHSYSQLNTWNTCKRKYYFSYLQGWSPDGSSPALAFGSAWGSAMDTVWSIMAGGTDSYDFEIIKAALNAWETTWVESGMTPTDEMPIHELEDLGARTRVTATRMLVDYIEERRSFLSKIRLVAVEDPFFVPISTEDEDTFYVGLMDKVYEDMRNGKIYAVDHKTTSAYARHGGFRFSFLDSFSPNAQMDGYLYALHHKYGANTGHLMIDAALVHKTASAFRFIPVYHSKDQLEAWLYETRRNISSIKEEQLLHENSNEPLATYPRNTASCHTYNGCIFRDVCSSVSRFWNASLPENFTTRERATAEHIGLTQEILDEVMKNA